MEKIKIVLFMTITTKTITDTSPMKNKKSQQQ